MTRFIIKKLIVQGVSYRRTIKFNENFTIISGDKTSGKSLILSLIDYCFGKSKRIDLKVQKELNDHCDQVFLEILINGEILTINRRLKQKQNNIQIYFCGFENIGEYTPKTVRINEAMNFFMEKLNISEYKIIKHQKHSVKKELQTISFRDIFRFVYVNQHALGTPDFLDKKDSFKSYKNPHAFQLMFNLVETDKGILKEELVNTQNKIEDANKVIDGLKSYLQDKDSMDFNALSATFQKNKIRIKKQNEAKQNIIIDSNSNKNYENEMYIKLKKDLEGMTNQVFENNEKKRRLNISIQSRKLLVEEYMVEDKEIAATLEINYQLVIPEQNIECPICNSTVSAQTHLELHDSLDAEKVLRKVQREITNKIKLVDKLIIEDKKKIEEIKRQVSRLDTKKSILNEAIVQFSKKTNVPFLSQLDSINNLMNGLVKDNEIVKEGLRIHRKVEEKEKEIIDLGATVSRLEDELKSIRINEKDIKSVFNFLNAEYKSYMKRFKYDTEGETYIDFEQFIPYYDGSSVYSHESGGLVECMQLSYLGAILQSKKNGLAAGHPGILLLDSISKYVGTLEKEIEAVKKRDDNQMDSQGNNSDDVQIEDEAKVKDPEVYKEIYNILIELSTAHQIILVENTPPDEFSEYIKYTFLNGARGFIDVEKNEFKEFDN